MNTERIEEKVAVRPPARLATRSLTAVPLLTLLLLASGCTRPAPAPGKRLAAASIFPIADLLRNVAGPEWTVEVIVPPGISAHVFEPSPSDVKKVARAQIVAIAGAGYDIWIQKLAGACASRARILDCGASVGIRGGGDLGSGTEHAEEHGHEGHDHGDTTTDPHWWLSPALAAQSLEPMAQVLAEVEPASSTAFLERARKYQAELLALDQELKILLAPAEGKEFISSHPAWIHFTSRYGMHAAGSIEPKPGREPSPRELRALIDEVRGGGFPVLFTEPQFPLSAAKIVAGDAGARLSLLDPVGGVPGRATYIEMMRFNARAVLEGVSVHAVPNDPFRGPRP